MHSRVTDWNQGLTIVSSIGRSPAGPTDLVTASDLKCIPYTLPRPIGGSARQQIKPTYYNGHGDGCMNCEAQGLDEGYFQVILLLWGCFRHSRQHTGFPHFSTSL